MHKLNADPEISGLKIDKYLLTTEVNPTFIHLQDIKDDTEENVLQDLIQFIFVSWPDKM